MSNYPDRLDFTVDPRNDKSDSVPIFFMESAEAFGNLHAQGVLGIFGPKGTGKTTLLAITAERTELLSEEKDEVLFIDLSDVLATGYTMPPRLAKSQHNFLGIETGVLKPYNPREAEMIARNSAFKKITSYVTGRSQSLTGNQEITSDPALSLSYEDRVAEMELYNAVFEAIESFPGYLFIANSHHLTYDSPDQEMTFNRETIFEALLIRLQNRKLHTAITHHAELDQYGSLDYSKLTRRAQLLSKAFNNQSLKVFNGHFSDPKDAQVILEQVMPKNVASENIANLQSLGNLGMQEVMYIYHNYKEAKEQHYAELLGTVDSPVTKLTLDERS